MKVGFLTGVLDELPLDEIVCWAGANGFRALELHCSAPPDGPLYLNGGLNVAKLDEPAARELRTLAEKNGVELSCLTWCMNLLDADEGLRRANADLVRRMIDAAALLNVDAVSTFAGRDLRRTVEDNLPLFEEVFEPLCSDAAAKGVRIAIENCPLMGGPAGDQAQNIAFSPALWRRMLQAVPDVGLNFDPSHLYWMGIDYLAAVKDFGKSIFHVHLKDTEIFEGVLAETGILADFKWFRYRLPGFGKIDWAGFISALREAGYDGALSIEHEDAVFRDSLEHKQQGLIVARKRIEMLLP